MDYTLDDVSEQLNFDLLITGLYSAKNESLLALSPQDYCRVGGSKGLEG